MNWVHERFLEGKEEGSQETLLSTTRRILSILIRTKTYPPAFDYMKEFGGPHEIWDQALEGLDAPISFYFANNPNPGEWIPNDPAAPGNSGITKPEVPNKTATMPHHSNSSLDRFRLNTLRLGDDKEDK